MNTAQNNQGVSHTDGTPSFSEKTHCRKYAVILAGGSGTRAGGDMPKQFQMLGDIPVLWWSVRAFVQADPGTHIILVMNPGFFDLWDQLYAELPEADRKIPVELVCGGRSRTHSVSNGLGRITAPEGALVAVHDAARPMVGVDLIDRAWKEVARTGSAIPAVPVTDSLRYIDDEGVTEVVDRDRYRRVQTPQTFDAASLCRAYSLAGENSYSDDATLYEAFIGPVTLIEGQESNIKITTPSDIRILRFLITQ